LLSTKYLNNWYQNTFLGRKCGQIFFFLQIYFFGEEKKKRVATFWMISVGFGAKFAKNGCITEFLSKKHPSYKIKIV
jgi:hypothetical protein